MYLGETAVTETHLRKSKLGKTHKYQRSKTMVKLRCDACDTEFQRPRRSMDTKRLNNNVFHVCSNCDAKRFAQKRGVERRKIWNMSASSSLPVGKL